MLKLIGATGRAVGTGAGRTIITIGLTEGPREYVITSHRSIDGTATTVNVSRDRDEALELYRIACNVIRDAALLD